MGLFLGQLDGVIKHARGPLLDQRLGGRDHLLQRIPVRPPNELEAKVIGPSRRQLGKVGVNLATGVAQTGGALGEGSEQRDALAVLPGDVGPPAALAVQQAPAFEVAHGAGDGRA